MLVQLFKIEIRLDMILNDEIIFIFLSFLQIFGDYYHFQHRKVAKRSLEAGLEQNHQLDSDPDVRIDVIHNRNCIISPFDHLYH